MKTRQGVMPGVAGECDSAGMLITAVEVVDGTTSYFSTGRSGRGLADAGIHSGQALKT